MVGGGWWRKAEVFSGVCESRRDEGGGTAGGKCLRVTWVVRATTFSQLSGTATRALNVPPPLPYLLCGTCTKLAMVSYREQ